MRWMITMVVLALAGCGAVETGETGSGLTAVDVEALTSEIHYLAPELSAAPLTLEEIGDPADGTAVGFGVHGDYLVAWAAPNGVPRVGDPHSVLAAWSIHPTPIADDVAPSDDTPNVVHPEDPEALVEAAEPADLLDDAYDPQLPGVELRRIWVDWWFDDPGEWIDWWGEHPGCI